MNYISETDIRNIVQKALAQALPPASPAPASAGSAPVENPCGSGKKRTIAVGSDHGGYELKTIVIAYLQELGHTVIDCGTTGKEAVDYPDFALAVAEKIRSHEACRGIVIDAAGIGSCMAANKVPGVRAAMCVDYATASNSREHNNANVLSLGAGLLGVNQVKLIIKTFLDTDFGGGRHARRVDKITDIEKKYMKEG
jgi:ribose 5-phosphate isomerase B